jgi:hypothetical protein
MARKRNNKLIGIILLVVGVVLIVQGLNEYGAFGSKLSRAISGEISLRTLAFFIGGGVCAVLGINKLR